MRPRGIPDVSGHAGFRKAQDFALLKITRSDADLIRRDLQDFNFDSATDFTDLH